MIEAKDLRIGNWVSTDEFEMHPIMITNIDFVERVLRGKMHVTPIPLTPEILEKCGFEKDDQDCYSRWNGNLLYSYSLEHGFCFGQGMEFSYEIEIKYLNQLQNLYFCLTGEELNIEL